MTDKTVYHIEAFFPSSGWVRNKVEHDTLESAQVMYKAISKDAMHARIVEVRTIEKIVEPAEATA